MVWQSKVEKWNIHFIESRIFNSFSNVCITLSKLNISRLIPISSWLKHRLFQFPINHYHFLALFSTLSFVSTYWRGTNYQQLSIIKNAYRIIELRIKSRIVSLDSSLGICNKIDKNKLGYIYILLAETKTHLVPN